MLVEEVRLVQTFTAIRTEYGWIVKFEDCRPDIRLPHMNWNDVCVLAAFFLK